MDALDNAIHNSIPGISGGLTPEQEADVIADQGETTEETLLRRVNELHAKVDKIVEIVEETINNLGNNPMMKMLGTLGGKKN